MYLLENTGGKLFYSLLPAKRYLAGGDLSSYVLMGILNSHVILMDEFN